MAVSPDIPNQGDEFALSDADQNEFERQGFLVREQVFDRDEISDIRDAFERLTRVALMLGTTRMYRGSQFVVEETSSEERATKKAVKRVVWCGAIEPVLSDFGLDPRLVRPSAQLMGTARMEQLINQAHFKFPGDEVSFSWHQDSVHRRYGTRMWDDITGEGSFIQTAIAVDPMTRENGPLQFIPGSHRAGHIPVDEQTGKLPEKHVDESRAVTVEMDPGDVAFFGPFVIHGSGPNNSIHPRRLFLNGFAYPGANHRDYPGRGAGRTVVV